MIVTSFFIFRSDLALGVIQRQIDRILTALVHPKILEHLLPTVAWRGFIFARCNMSYVKTFTREIIAEH